MKAVLNVKGTKLSVLSIHYRVNGEPSSVYTVDEEGREEKYCDKVLEGETSVDYDGFLDLKAALDYPEIKAKIAEDIENKIESLTRRTDRIANEFIQAYKSDDSVFTEKELEEMQIEYHSSVSQIEGLQMAIPLVLTECNNNV